MSITFGPQARQELVDLLAGVRAANPRAADRVQDEVQGTLELLEANPQSGPRLRVRNPNSATSGSQPFAGTHNS